MKGIFVSLDGVDGAGKSTQIKLLVDWYEQHGTGAIFSATQEERS